MLSQLLAAVLKIFILILVKNMLIYCLPSQSSDISIATTTVFNQQEDPDFRPYLPSTCERVVGRGQLCERRQTRTEDGYLLALHRVHSPGLDYGPPVLFIHGLLSASDQWLLYGRDHDLASILADKGYDVWLGDLRGNAYSRRHVTLSPEQPEFWDFSFHEHGYYDIPAMIDHIRLTTGHKRVFYVGYSLGGTVFFVACSSRPAVNEKIRAGVVIAPYMFTPVHLNKALQLTIRIIFSVMRRWRTLRVFEVFPRSNATLAINQLFCEPKSRLMPLCLQLYDHVFGLTQELNENLLLDVMSTFRAGSSAKTLYHCAQVMYSNSLKYYDYEPEENLKRYGQTEPPDYDLSRVTAPVSLHYSLQDWFVNAENVDKLAERLPHLIGKYVVPSQSFNHIDFMHIGECCGSYWAGMPKIPEMLPIPSNNATICNYKNNALKAGDVQRFN